MCKKCVECGGDIIRRDNEKPYNYNLRVLCGAKKCHSSYAGRITRERHKDKLYIKHCAICNVEMRSDQFNMSPSKFLERKVCDNPSCLTEISSRSKAEAHKFRKLGIVAKECGCCGDEFKRNKGERHADFAVRELCDECVSDRKRSTASVDFEWAKPGTFANMAMLFCSGKIGAVHV